MDNPETEDIRQQLFNENTIRFLEDYLLKEAEIECMFPEVCDVPKVTALDECLEKDDQEQSLEELNVPTEQSCDGLKQTPESISDERAAPEIPSKRKRGRPPNSTIVKENNSRVDEAPYADLHRNNSSSNDRAMSVHPAERRNKARQPKHPATQKLTLAERRKKQAHDEAVRRAHLNAMFRHLASTVPELQNRRVKIEDILKGGREAVVALIQMDVGQKMNIFKLENEQKRLREKQKKLLNEW